MIRSLGNRIFQPWSARTHNAIELLGGTTHVYVHRILQHAILQRQGVSRVESALRVRIAAFSEESVAVQWRAGLKDTVPERPYHSNL